MPPDQAPIKEIGEGTIIRRPELCNIYGPGSIGAGCRIGAFVEIGPKVLIGNRCTIGAYTFIPEGVIIGNDVFIGPRVTFTNDKYPPSHGGWRTLTPIHMEDFVTIGAGVVILPEVLIGHHAIIGAGAVVTANVAPHACVAGNPGRLLRC